MRTWKQGGRVARLQLWCVAAPIGKVINVVVVVVVLIIQLMHDPTYH